jgi:hypothetical protein
MKEETKMDLNPYAKKKTVFTKDMIAKLAMDNREARIRRYPETAQYGQEAAQTGYVMKGKQK